MRSGAWVGYRFVHENAEHQWWSRIVEEPKCAIVAAGIVTVVSQSGQYTVQVQIPAKVLLNKTFSQALNNLA